MNWEKELYNNGLQAEVEPILVKLRDNFPFVDFSKVRFTYLRDNTRRKMGRITYNPDGTAEIAIHPGLEGDDIKEIITHELGHFTAWKWKGECLHGYFWGFVMILYGFNPNKYARSEVVQQALKR